MMLVDIDAIRLSMQTQLNGHISYLADGKCADFAEYKSLTGKVRGLRDAMEAMSEQLRKQNNGDDDL